MNDRLKRSPATISYELSRCEPYQAEVAQTYAEYQRSRCGRKTKSNDKLRQIILNHLRLSRSPEMIAHGLKIATKSIYNWLNQGKIDFSLNDLPEHGVRQRRNLDQRSKYNHSLGRWLSFPLRGEVYGTWSNLQEGSTVNERLPDTLVDVAVCNVYFSVANINRQKEEIKKPPCSTLVGCRTTKISFE